MAQRPLLIGEHIRQAREARGFNQAQLAREAQIDPAWIYRLESGERSNCSFQAAARIAKALGVSLDQLANLQDPCGDVPRMRRIYALAETAGLLEWNDTDLAGLFTLLGTLAPCPNPVAVLAGCLGTDDKRGV